MEWSAPSRCTARGVYFPSTIYIFLILYRYFLTNILHFPKNHVVFFHFFSFSEFLVQKLIVLSIFQSFSFKTASFYPLFGLFVQNRVVLSAFSIYIFLNLALNRFFFYISSPPRGGSLMENIQPWIQVRNIEINDFWSLH